MLLGDHLVAKIADFGLSKNDETYVKTSSVSLENHRYSTHIHRLTERHAREQDVQIQTQMHTDTQNYNIYIYHLFLKYTHTYMYVCMPMRPVREERKEMLMKKLRAK